MKVFVDDILSMISYFEHKPRNKVVEIAFSDFDNKEEKGYLFAELKEDRVDAVVLSKSVISDVKTQINKGLSRSFGDAAVIEEGGYSFTDEENHHFKTDEYNKLQDIAVMAFGMMEFVKDTSSYTMRKFVHMHSNRLLDYIKIEKTWLDGDRDRLDEDGDYWLDEIDHSEITYQLGIAYNYKGAEFDNIAFLDGIDDAIAYADGFWEALSEEEKAKYNKFDLCVIEAVDDDYTVEYYSKYTIKDYIKEDSLDEA